MLRPVAVLALVLATGLWSATAHAGASGERQAFSRGATLAKQGRFREAIAEFKKADAAEPEAKHDCYIALAYRRLERWGLAELHLSRCFERAGHDARLPPWTRRLKKDVRAGIKRSRLVKVDIRVEPAVRGTRVTVSDFGPGEPFAPRAVYLPRGAEVVEVRAPGHPRAREDLVVRGGSARELLVRLRGQSGAPIAGRSGEGAHPARGGAAKLRRGSPGKPEHGPEAATKRAGASGGTARGGAGGAPRALRHPALGLADSAGRRGGGGNAVSASAAQVRKPAGARLSGWTWAAFGVGAAGLASGLTFHILAYENQGKLGAAKTPAEYKKYEGPYDRERLLAYSSYAIAAVGIGTGLYLYFHSRHRGAPPSLAVSGGTDGRTALVQLTWIH